MSKPNEKVDLILSHNQDVAGESKKAGEEVSVDPRLARALVARGSAQRKQSVAAEKAAKDPEAATVAELRALAEQRGVDLKGVSHKADIQAAIDAVPENTAASAEKGGK